MGAFGPLGPGGIPIRIKLFLQRERSACGELNAVASKNTVTHMLHRGLRKTPCLGNMRPLRAIWISELAVVVHIRSSGARKPLGEPKVF